METSKYNWMNTGHAAIFDKETFETLFASFPLFYYDEFLGAWLTIPAAGAAESGCDWVVKDTGNATQIKLADHPGGAVRLLFTNASEKQEALLYHDDNRNFDVTKGCIFETKLRVNTLPTLVSEIQFGLGDDYVEGGFDNLTYQVGFDLDGSGLVYARKDDNDSAQTVTTGITLDAGNEYIFRIDCTDVTDIKFFIDGVQVCASTAFPYIATGANAVLQPYFSIYKASGEGLGIITIDYVKIWQNRS